MNKTCFGKERRIMNYVIGAAVGLLWGAVIDWMNSLINKNAIPKAIRKKMGI